MKLLNVWNFLLDLKLAIKLAFLPTLKDVLRSPSLLFHPRGISRQFMSYVWNAYGDGVDTNSGPVKKSLITPYAKGVVLDLGAGHGHTVNHLDHSKVNKYIALEPNVLMHPHIRTLAQKAGFTESEGTLQILPYGIEDLSSIVSALGGSPRCVDTIISILTLCSIPEPERTLRGLLEVVLKPGGQFLYYEHVLNSREDVAWWQRFLTPVWAAAFDGCRLDRPTHVWVEKMDDIWAENGEGEDAENRKVWGVEGEDVESMFWHRIGRYVKRS
ncbi:hypothetical protein K474DRAFT_1650758 [Panus rudis PR-1116 ss-1]|nr:hypothetical protein K474DRAFT_1650758 [Panus rudis PR-1116 ss-1]